MGQTCLAINCQTSQQIYLKQHQILNHHLRSINCSQKRERYLKQLSAINTKDLIGIYKTTSLNSSQNNDFMGLRTKEGESEEVRRSYSNSQTKQLREEQFFLPLKDESVVVKKEQLTSDLQLQFKEIGQKSIGKNQRNYCQIIVAVILMHGKSQNDIGYDGLLGTYDIGLDSACSLFEYLVHKLKKLSQICCKPSCSIKLYILANSLSKKEIMKYFEDQSFFGYGKENIFFFSQDVYPILNTHGQIMLKSNSQIHTDTLGNGMMLWQLYNKKILHHLKLQGVKYLFFGNIGNILMKIGDPIMLGYLIKTHRQVVTNCVSADVIEGSQVKFGCIGANENGKIKIYENLKKIPENCKFINSGSCFIELNFLQNLFKSTKFYSEFTPSKNASKTLKTCYSIKNKFLEIHECLLFSLYYHDIFQSCTHIGIVEIDQNQFNPLKSIEEPWSAKGARDKIWKIHTEWAQREGFNILESGRVQFSPRLTYSGEGVKEELQKRLQDKTIKMPIYIN